MSKETLRLTDRLAKIETMLHQAIIEDRRNTESKIVWRLLGVISFWARPDNERLHTAAKAKWLLAEIEDILKS